MVRAPGSHPPNVKNRSSKYLICLTKHKSIFRSMSNEVLNAYKCAEAQAELHRREKKNAKKTAKLNTTDK